VCVGVGVGVGVGVCCVCCVGCVLLCLLCLVCLCFFFFCCVVFNFYCVFPCFVVFGRVWVCSVMLLTVRYSQNHNPHQLGQVEYSLFGKSRTTPAKKAFHLTDAARKLSPFSQLTPEERDNLPLFASLDFVALDMNDVVGSYVCCLFVY
jgi:hypothetical protein